MSRNNMRGNKNQDSFWAKSVPVFNRRVFLTRNPVDTYVSINGNFSCDKQGTLEEKMRLSDEVLGELLQEKGRHNSTVFMEDMFERPEHLSQVLQSVGLPAFDSTIVGNCGGKTKKAYKVSNQNTLKSIYPELVGANKLGDIHCKKGSPSHQSKHKKWLSCGRCARCSLTTARRMVYWRTTWHPCITFSLIRTSTTCVGQSCGSSRATPLEFPQIKPLEFT